MDTLNRNSEARRFVRACRRQPVDRIPVWLMRQAGRYQPEYRALKERMGGFWALSTNADSITEATLFAQRSLAADAAIIFSDITVPSWAMGLDLEFAPGPKFKTPVRDAKGLAALSLYDPHEKCDFLMQGIRQTRAGLPDEVSLIGFVGAPFTLAGYMIEGYPSRSWLELKKVVYGEPKFLHNMLSKIAEAVIEHARAQVEAGCDALQLFDTTSGELGRPELTEFAFHYAKRVLQALKPLGVPLIYFGRNIGHALEEAASLGSDVLGVDWGTPMQEARQRLGNDIALMGNLDPTTLFCAKEVITSRAEDILNAVAKQPGFIFNLGHGVLQHTPVDHVKHLIDVVHDFRC